MPKLHLRVLTADSIKFDQEVDMIIVRSIIEDLGRRSVVGDLGILPGHMPLAAVLGISPLRILDESFERGERIMAVYGGLLDVQNNLATITTEMALWPDEIDAAQAEAERQRAESRLQAIKDDDMAIRRNQIALRRALVRNPYLKVLVMEGYYDLATPYYAANYTMDHLDLPANFRKQISYATYDAGHMVYLPAETLQKMKADEAMFIDGATKGE